MKRGLIYWVNLEPAAPPEFGKIRPALIVSNSEQNNLLPSVVVIPLSSKAPEIWPLRLAIALPNGKPSFAILPGIRQVNKARLHDMIGMATETFLQNLDKALSLYLNISSTNPCSTSTLFT